ncbi:glycosyltransferase family 77 protein [Gonapodya prolifera JEL478]|uniref:Glycosyltransferase family 77 protein n=1 Tax=Gonapodya prolifera (strain JEL478) TaxID=1344416 RepID=A0A139ARS7_GONPJ|nr:glycosyltransferase family 77 protein [Gonapodya prolifera JEL478]|eukprot:KXS19243.1 glycosyltransferase family 77 protein [Gonapodya prolifera JEL478]
MGLNARTILVLGGILFVCVSFITFKPSPPKSSPSPANLEQSQQPTAPLVRQPFSDPPPIYSEPLLDRDIPRPAAIPVEAVGVYDGAPEWLLNTVAIISCNLGYLDMLLNFYCNARKVFPINLLVLPQDEELYEFLSVNATQFSVLHPSVFSFHSANEASLWRSEAFNDISVGKVRAVRYLLQWGYDVWLSDVDIAYKSNPIPHFAGDVDFEFQSNAGCKGQEFQLGEEPNTGFYIIKSNPRTIRMLLDVEESHPRRPDIDDQTLWADILQEWWRSEQAVLIPSNVTDVKSYIQDLNFDEEPFTFRQLPCVKFPIGFDYFR